MNALRISAALALALLAASGTGAFAAGTSTTTELTPAEIRARLDQAAGLIEDASYARAVDVLNEIIRSDRKVADAHNLLGYSYRKLERFERAEKAYDVALRLDPEHLGALEYLGELYLETDRRDEAEELLRRLEAACPDGCEELDDLREAFGDS